MSEFRAASGSGAENLFIHLFEEVSARRKPVSFTLSILFSLSIMTAVLRIFCWKTALNA